MIDKKRVVVTGMAALTPLGDTWEIVKNNLETHTSAVRYMPHWDKIRELNTRLAAPIEAFSLPAHYTRKRIRTMGRVSKLAVRATELALQQADLLDHPSLTDGSTGVAYGSCTGSTDAMQDFSKFVADADISDVNATTYLRMMSHTAPVNIATFFNLQGRVVATSTACTSGSQGIGYAYEAIQTGKQKVMVAGGAEELCPTEAAIFDTLYATSLRNDAPTMTPRPFDRDRDGLVVGEGACTLILESLEHASARGAPIIAEVVGYGTNCDGSHVTQPSAKTMARVMTLALDDAQLSAEQIDYINAHGTATKLGDASESAATAEVFGNTLTISSLKGNIGHTLGACGAIEAWACIHMMREGWFAPTHNLQQVADDCAKLDYIIGEGRQMRAHFVMNNNFAFGGINTSLIFKNSSS